MDYSRFEALQNKSLGDNGTEQERMEDFFRQLCADDSGQQERINEKMKPEFLSCDAAEKKLSILFMPELWQANPSSYLHGGMIATAVDITAGLLVKFIAKSNEAVTVEMNCNYLRAIPIGQPYCATAQAVKTGKTLYFVNVLVELLDQEKPAATATLVYMDVKKS